MKYRTFVTCAICLQLMTLQILKCDNLREARELLPRRIPGKSSGIRLSLSSDDKQRRIRVRKKSDISRGDTSTEDASEPEFSVPHNFLHVVPFRLPDGTPLLRWRPVTTSSAGLLEPVSSRSAVEASENEDSIFSGTFFISEATSEFQPEMASSTSQMPDTTKSDEDPIEPSSSANDVVVGSTIDRPSANKNGSREEKAFNFDANSMNQIEDDSKDASPEALTSLSPEDDLNLGLSLIKEESFQDSDSKLKTMELLNLANEVTESAFQTTFMAQDVIGDTTLMPEMIFDESDDTSVTLSKQKSTKDECCVCPAPKENVDNETSTETSPIETTTMKDRGGRTFGGLGGGETEIETTTLDMSAAVADAGLEDDTDFPGPLGLALAANPLVNYLIRLQRIYTLDLEVLDRLIALLKGVNMEVIPAIMAALEPILPILLMDSIQSLDLKDLVTHLGQTVKKSTFQFTSSTQFKDLNFINIGPVAVRPTDYVKEEDLFQLVHSIVADYDHTGKNFPIQTFIFKANALNILKIPENSHVTAWILARKLYEYLEGSNISVEIADGEVMLDAHLPAADVVDSCATTLKLSAAHAKIRARRTSLLHVTGVVPGTIGEPTALLVRGDVDVDVGVGAAVYARFGKNLFGHCFTKIQNNFPFSLLSHGKAWVGARIIVSDVRIERRSPNSPPGPFYTSPYQTSDRRVIDLAKLLPEAAEGEKGATDGLKPFLVFKINIKLEFQLVSFNVDHVGVDNCELKFLGLKVFSACGIIQKQVKDSLKKLTHDLSEFHAPRILAEIEKVLRTRLGDEIAIPILLVDEKNELLGSLIKKADQVTKLKADLLDDLSGLVDLLSAFPKTN